MKFGVNIVNFGPGVRPDTFLEWARRSEDLGYHSVMISDHVAVTPSVGQRYPEPFYDPFTVLAWLASATTRIKLGTTVCVLPYRNPILMARQVANIDHLSGGRFIFGVGVGNAEDEFATLGVPFEKRGALANEQLDVIVKLWTSDEPVSYDGRHAQIKDVSPIKPLQTPHPPIWVGGGSEATLRRTARFGDAYHPHARWPEALRGETMPRIREMAAARGRSAPAFCPRIRLDIRESPIDGTRAYGEGSIDQIRSDLQHFEALGAEEVLLDWSTGDLERTKDHEHGWRMLSQMAEQVLDLEGEGLRP